MTTPTAAGETGWSDEHAVPAPWPHDFFDPDTSWRPHIANPPDLAPNEQPF
jgi:hypothetical protein